MIYPELLPYLDLINEGLSNIQSLVGISKYDFKTLLQTQLSPHSGQPSMGPRSQSQRGDPQQDHVTVAGRTLLGSSEQGLYNLQGLHRGVFVKGVGAADSAGRSHQSYAVVLDQDCSTDDCTVQLGEPGRNFKGFLKHFCVNVIIIKPVCEVYCVCVD